MTKRVIVFRRNLLQLSETFIRDQVCSLNRWEPVLLGVARAQNGLDLAGLRLALLPTPGTRLSERAFRMLRNRLWLPDSTVVEAIEALNGQLVHAHFGTDAVDIWPSVKRTGLPMLVTLHGFDINCKKDWWEAGNAGPARRRYPRRLVHMSRHDSVAFIAVSNAIRNKAIQYGIAPEKITVSHIGVDTDKFCPPSSPHEKRRKLILFVGRLVEKKGAAYLIQALPAVCKAHPDAQLTVIGGGPLSSELVQLAESLSAPVTFLGPCSHDVVKRHLLAASVLCAPSITATSGDAEGLPIAILEAQACGVPVVTTTSGGCGEGIVDGATGHVVAERDVAAIAVKLISVLTQGELSDNLRASARVHTLKRFRLSACTESLESLYDLHHSKNACRAYPN